MFSSNLRRSTVFLSSNGESYPVRLLVCLIEFPASFMKGEPEAFLELILLILLMPVTLLELALGLTSFLCKDFSYYCIFMMSSYISLNLTSSFISSFNWSIGFSYTPLRFFLLNLLSPFCLFSSIAFKSTVPVGRVATRPSLWISALSLLSFLLIWVSFSWLYLKRLIIRSLYYWSNSS